MRIIGIDPGTIHVGFGILEVDADGLRRIDGGSIDCPATAELAKRLMGIHHGLQTVMREWKPDAAAVETVFFGKNSMAAIRIGEGRGVALLSAAEAGVPVYAYEPALVKRSVCGNGRAAKEQVRRMVTSVLHLPEAPRTDHEADALAMAICHALHIRRGLPARRPGGGRTKAARGNKPGLPPNILAALERSKQRGL